MLTKTDVANNALAYLSAEGITSVFDQENTKARVISSVFDSVAAEVMRSHRWSCLVRRVELSRLADRPLLNRTFGYQYQFELPTDNLRVLDINGEPWNRKERSFDINGRMLLMNSPKAFLRYIAHVKETAEWDVLLAEAVALKLAMRIARTITKDGASSEQLYGLYKSRIAEAQHVDAMENGSGENSPLERILDSSPLVNSAGGGRRFFRPVDITGLNINLEEPRPELP